jgi:transcriptional regulator with XRE-family HTH domain
MLDNDQMFLALLQTTLALKRNQVTQWDLAEALGIDNTLISRYVRGRRPIPMEVKEGMISFLGIDRTLAGLSEKRSERR